MAALRAAFGSAERTAPERSHEHGNDDLDILDAGLEGHASALGSGLLFGLLDALVKAGEMQWVAGFDFTVEFQYGALVKDVLHIPLRFHGEVVAAQGADGQRRRHVLALALPAAMGAGD